MVAQRQPNLILVILVIPKPSASLWPVADMTTALLYQYHADALFSESSRPTQLLLFFSIQRVSPHTHLRYDSKVVKLKYKVAKGVEEYHNKRLREVTET